MLQALLLAGIAAKLALSAALPPRSDVSTQVLAPRVDIWQPAVGSKFQVILNGVVTSVDPSIQIIDIDLFNTPAETIKSLKEVSFKQVICYINAGGSETWRPDYGRFPPEALGAALLKGGGTQWAGENWVDIRHPVVVDILKERIRLAADKGCNGVDLDNVGTYFGFLLRSFAATSVTLTKNYRRLPDWWSYRFPAYPRRCRQLHQDFGGRSTQSGIGNWSEELPGHPLPSVWRYPVRC